MCDHGQKTLFSYNFARSCIPKTMHAYTLPCSEKKKKKKKTPYLREIFMRMISNFKYKWLPTQA